MYTCTMQPFKFTRRSMPKPFLYALEMHMPKSGCNVIRSKSHAWIFPVRAMRYPEYVQTFSSHKAACREARRLSGVLNDPSNHSPLYFDVRVIAW